MIVGAALTVVLLRFTGAGPALLNTGVGSPVFSDDVDNEQLSSLAFEIAGHLENKNYKGISKLIHPEYGLIVSPYATVTPASNKCFTAGEVARFDSDNTTYIWGVADGTGEPIQLTPEDFFSQYIFNVNYFKASIVGVDYIIKSGNSLENITDIFPGAHFVDLNYPGSEASGYSDWSTLRLVFEDYNGVLMLSAIIHSQATL